MIALLLCIIPYSPVIETQTDVYEYNRIYDDAGKVVLTQRIFWDVPDVAGWRLVHRGDYGLRRGEVLFWDGGNTPTLRRMRFKSRTETHTNYDPEMTERNVLPEAERRGIGSKP